MLFFTHPFKENQGVATHDVWPLVPNFRDRGVITPFQQNKRGYGVFFFFNSYSQQVKNRTRFSLQVDRSARFVCLFFCGMCRSKSQMC